MVVVWAVVVIACGVAIWAFGHEDGDFTTPEALADHMVVLFEAQDAAGLGALASDHVVGAEADAAEMLAPVGASELTGVTWTLSDDFPKAVTVTFSGVLETSGDDWSARVNLYRGEGSWAAGFGTPRGNPSGPYTTER